MHTNIAPARRHITESDLCSWLGQAAPGDELVYHKGSLAHDRAPTFGLLPQGERAELLRVARRALWAAEMGYVHLVQRRNGPDDYTYLLIARPRPTMAPGSILATLVAEP